jgi:5-methyltetrahydropteroyltriglutamate--homocysteine methyltransferase
MFSHIEINCSRWPRAKHAAIIHTRPSGYSFLPELQDCACRQISIETAQSNLDCSVLTALAGKTIMLGVIDLSDMQVETPATVAARIRRALPFVKAENVVVCTDCGMKYLPRDVAAAKMQAMVEGANIVRRELAGQQPYGVPFLIEEMCASPSRSASRDVWTE